MATQSDFHAFVDAYIHGMGNAPMRCIVCAKMHALGAPCRAVGPVLITGGPFRSETIPAHHGWIVDEPLPTLAEIR